MSLPWEFAARICRGYLSREFTTGICRGNLPREFAVAICRGFFVFASKSFFVYVRKSCLYESKPFLYVSKTFLFVKFSSLTAIIFVIVVAAVGHRNKGIKELFPQKCIFFSKKKPDVAVLR